MCGIVGHVGTDHAGHLEAALHVIRHRGPDAHAVYRERHGALHVGLGHTRLSVLDLSSAANQPFQSADGLHVLVYNGEMYNHRALRDQLSRRGWRFRTHSDTEVLLAALTMLGELALPLFDGMFAFAWLDRARGRLLLGRDRLGIKPLYVRRGTDGGLSFGSELRAVAAVSGIPNRPDPSCYAEFLLNGFLYEPSSGIAGVEKLQPGHILSVDLANGVTEERRFATAVDDIDDNVDDLASRGTLAGEDVALESLLARAVYEQAVADVKLGLFFSGGVDSAALVAASPVPLHGLFVSYGDERGGEGGDERWVGDVARALKLPLEQVALRTPSQAPDQVLAQFAEVAHGTEEPISDYTFVATRLISQVAREHGYTVMLSGMGGDELFGGYPRYLMARHHRRSALLAPLVGAATPIARRVPYLAKKIDRAATFFSERDFGLAYASLIGYFSPAEVERLLGGSAGIERFRARIDQLLRPMAGRSPLAHALHLDRRGFLAHNLTVTDKASMAAGIEVRVPLLSNALLAHADALRDDSLVRGRTLKRPLRAILERHLPHSVIHRTKTGFNPPLDGRIRALGRERVLERCTSGPIASVIDRREVRRYVDDHFAGQSNQSYRLWQLLYFSLWLESMQH